MNMTQPMFIMIYIIPSLFISPLISLSMNSWFMIWMTLEFNLMTFIPFIIFFNNKYKNISMKYFIIQAFSSSIFIFCANIQMINFYENNMINMMMNMSLLMKMGAAPFHSWFINLMNNMQWINCLILSTLQKIIPMIMLIYMINYKIILIFSIMSCMLGAMLGLNHQSIRLIMSYSSLNHIGWMLINLLISKKLWMLYFLCYSLINMSIMMMLNKFKIFFLNQILFIDKKINKIILLMNFLSISGLPPMLGFLMKWLSIYYMNWNNNMIIMMLLIMLSIITFTFYTRICFSIMTQFKMNFKLSLILKFKNIKLKFNELIIFNSYFYIWMMSLWFF